MFRGFCWSHDSRLRPMHAPIWVSRPHLPILFFFEFRLFSIVSTFGIGLPLDGPTKLVSRPNVARVCVEVGLLKENLPNRLWIGSTVYGSLAINRFFLNTAGILLSLYKPGRRKKTVAYPGRTPGASRTISAITKIKEYIPLLYLSVFPLLSFRDKHFA